MKVQVKAGHITCFDGNRQRISRFELGKARDCGGPVPVSPWRGMGRGYPTRCILPPAFRLVSQPFIQPKPRCFHFAHRRVNSRILLDIAHDRPCLQQRSHICLARRPHISSRQHHHHGATRETTRLRPWRGHDQIHKAPRQGRLP